MSNVPVLHVPYTFLPDPPGGTEIYVAALIAGMRNYGYHGVVAAPGHEDANYEHDGISVYRFKTDGKPVLGHAYGVPDEVAAQAFRDIFRRIAPRIVHIHSHTAAVSERLIDEAKAGGAKVFFTYHSPTVSCVRGTMMHMGSTSCDGVLTVKRCSVCTFQKHGFPVWIGNLASMIPAAIGQHLSDEGISGSLVTGLNIPSLVAGAHARFHAMMNKSDCVIAVCRWVREMLVANGVAPSKLILCRQGVPAGWPGSGSGRERKSSGQKQLRLGYFGRIDPSKGLDIVFAALKAIPDVPVMLEVFGVEQPGSSDYASRLRAMADTRVCFRGQLSGGAIARAMAECDFVVVPSRWLETGPLVVYEAFAAGTPVLGSAAGGIAELVRDGVDGVLVPANDRIRWAQAIADLAHDRERVSRLRAGVRPPRTMSDVAREMAGYYSALVPGRA